MGCGNIYGHRSDDTSSKPVCTTEELSEIDTLIRNTTGQNWALSQHSLEFFYSLWSDNTEACTALLNRLQQLCSEQALFLKAEHIDAVIASWDRLQRLPTNSLAYLNRYLSTNLKNTLHHNHPRSIQKVVQCLRTQCAPAIIQKAAQHHLKHHMIYHALEIKVRTMMMLTEQLKVLHDDHPQTLFLREIIGFFIEMHDLEQKDKGAYGSVEQATAARLANSIIDAFELHQTTDASIRTIIEVLADWVIVLGTTMIWSPTKTMDLSELFFIVEQAAVDANMGSNQRNNQSFMALLGIVALVSGVCDKNPAAVRPILEKEQSDMNTMSELQHYLHQQPLIIERFFSSTEKPLVPYIKNASPTLQQQAWRTTWVAHLNMRAELSVFDPSISNAAIQLIDCLTEAQNTLFLAELSCDNMDVQISELMRIIFFAHREKYTHGLTSSSTIVNGLEQEVQFSRTQFQTLSFAHQKILELMPLFDGRNPLEAADALGLEPNAPVADAENMLLFQAFYDTCNDSEKAQLMHELFFLAVQQAGKLYAQRPDLAYDPDFMACNLNSPFTHEQTAHIAPVDMSSHSRFFISLDQTSQKTVNKPQNTNISINMSSSRTTT